MRTFTDKEILDRTESLPTFKGYPNGIMDVWVRSRADEYDKFDDAVFTYDCFGATGKPQFIMKCTGTTNAGSFGLKHWRTYNPLGCAVLKSDVIVYNSHVYGLHKGKEAYIQGYDARFVPFPYYRDNNNNEKAEEFGKIYSDRIGANCHRAGTYSSVILNWSVACLVRNRLAEFEKWLGFMIKKGKPPLTVCILKEWSA